MVKFHPDTRFLTDYAAGSLPESQALCVAAHLHYCPACRTKVGELAELGSELFVRQDPVEVSDGCFNSTLARIDAISDGQFDQLAIPDQKTATPARHQTLPRAIHNMTGGDTSRLHWSRIGKAFSYADIPVQDDKRQTSLMYIKAGGKLPKHHHKGDEITVVLKGSFSDQEGRYHVGDYIVRSSGDTHTPVASQDEDCLCLATLDAPIIMNNWLYRLLVPLIGLLPSST